MIKDTSAQDVQVTPKRRVTSRMMMVAGGVLMCAAAVGAVGPGVVSLFSSEHTVSKQQLRFAKVQRGDLQRDLSVQGKIVAAVSPTLFASSNGTVSLSVKAGDSVTKDQVLAIIDSPELTNQYDQEMAREQELKLEVGRQKIATKASLLDNKQRTEMAQVDLEAAQTASHRAEVSIKTDLISKEEYDQYQVQLKKAQLQYNHAKENETLQKEQLEFELTVKQLQLERQQFVVSDLKRQIDALQLRSPLDGLVGAVNVRQKEAVNKNQALISVVDLTAFEIEVAIPESYADDLGVGLVTQVSFNGETHQGELTAISPEVIEGQVAGRVRFSEQTPAGLRQNQRVSARVLIESRQNVLKVRRGAFIESSGGKYAYVVQNHNATRASIQIGAKSMGEVEIISGLNEGDQIIISSSSDYDSKQQLFIAQ